MPAEQLVAERDALKLANAAKLRRLEWLRAELNRVQSNYDELLQHWGALRGRVQAQWEWYEKREAECINEAFKRREVLGASELTAWQRKNPKPQAAIDVDGVEIDPNTTYITLADGNRVPLSSVLDRFVKGTK